MRSNPAVNTDASRRPRVAGYLDSFGGTKCTVRIESWTNNYSAEVASAAPLPTTSGGRSSGSRTAIAAAAARLPAPATLQICTLHRRTSGGLRVKNTLYASIFLQHEALPLLSVSAAVHRFPITRAAGGRSSFRQDHSMTSQRCCRKFISFGVRARHGHVQRAIYRNPPSILMGGGSAA